MTTEVSLAAQGEEGRRQRGIDLFRDAAFERTSKVPEVWEIETVYGSINTVEMDRGTCTCADYEINTHQRGIANHLCKHRVAVDLKSRKLARDVREIARAGYFIEGPA